MAPRLKILMTSGFKKGTQIYYFCSLKSPRKQTPFRFPSGTLMERDTLLESISISLEDLIKKNSSNKKAPRKKHPSMFPKSGAPKEIDAHIRALLNIS